MKISILPIAIPLSCLLTGIISCSSDVQKTDEPSVATTATTATPPCNFRPTLVDLVPVRRIHDGNDVVGPNGFCDISDDGTSLLVRVRNVGCAQTDETLTGVTFFWSGNNQTSFQQTPQLLPNQTSAALSFNIPAGCFDSDCDFKIAVDADDRLIEGGGGPNRELNNTEVGICIG